MKRFAFYRQGNQIFARFITPNMEYAAIEAIFDCDRDFGVIMFGDGGIRTAVFDSYDDAMEFVFDVERKHPDYKKEFCDKSDFIFRKGDSCVTIKIVC